jgi:aminotransferase
MRRKDAYSPSNASPISRRVQRIPASDTKQMPILAARVGDCVSLGQGVPSFETPPHIIDAVCRALRDDPASGKYSLQPGMKPLRQAISDYLKREKGIKSDPDSQIAVTVGAMEGLLAAVLALVEKADEVILLSPTYASYIEQVLLAGGKPVFVPLRPSDWSLDVDLVDKAITKKTKLLIICNPANPTGTMYSDEDIRRLAKTVLKHGIYLISDETYDYLTYDCPIPISPASIPDMAEHVISVFSFSKKYAMTGWRAGYITAPPSLMAGIMKVHDVAAICAPVPSQHAALAALIGPTEPIRQMRDTLNKRRKLCCNRLDEIKDAFDYVKPSGAFYVMARYLFSDAPSRETAIRLLNEARVITIPGGSFGPGGEGHLRLSYGGTEEEIEEAFDRIAIWLRKQ